MAEPETDPRLNLRKALDQMGRVLSQVDEARAGDPTPCSGWDVRQLVAHIIGTDLPNFEASGRGEAPEWRRTPELGNEPWAEAYRMAAERVAEAWAEADLEAPVETPAGPMPRGARISMMVAELVVHSWDLAKATGQDPQLNPELCELAIAWSRPMLKPEMRGPDKAFGPEVPVAESAPIQDRVIGWFGRDPAWSPA